jgi:hypothetical protein
LRIQVDQKDTLIAMAVVGSEGPAKLIGARGLAHSTLGCEKGKRGGRLRECQMDRDTAEWIRERENSEYA